MQYFTASQCSGCFQPFFTSYWEKIQEHKNISWLLCLHFSLGPSHHLSAMTQPWAPSLVTSQSSRDPSTSLSKAAKHALVQSWECALGTDSTRGPWQQDISAPDHLNFCSPAGKLVLTSHNSSERESIQEETRGLPFSQLTLQENECPITTRHWRRMEKSTAPKKTFNTLTSQKR